MHFASFMVLFVHKRCASLHDLAAVFLHSCDLRSPVKMIITEKNQQGVCAQAPSPQCFIDYSTMNAPNKNTVTQIVPVPRPASPQAKKHRVRSLDYFVMRPRHSLLNHTTKKNGNYNGRVGWYDGEKDIKRKEYTSEASPLSSTHLRT